MGDDVPYYCHRLLKNKLKSVKGKLHIELKSLVIKASIWNQDGSTVVYFSKV